MTDPKDKTRLPEEWSPTLRQLKSSLYSTSEASRTADREEALEQFGDDARFCRALEMLRMVEALRVQSDSYVQKNQPVPWDTAAKLVIATFDLQPSPQTEKALKRLGSIVESLDFQTPPH